ncbi:TonB family protein [Bdellovibrio bacteriovorus]|uniref:AgmX/PglI C-terminal domain-containing protein n=1 Tax=Bdellovibrio bacteriovorus TaxID=959 RepID=UPI003CFF5808
MSTAKLLILENRLGQKVRTFAVDSESLNIVYLKNSRRIEAVSNLQALDSNDIEYRLLQTVDLAQMGDQGVALEGLGRLRLADASAQNSPTYQLADEKDDEQLKVMLKKTSLAHLAAVLSLMMGAWIWASYFTKNEEPMLVTIELPQEKPVQKAEPRQHVQVSQKKIKQTNKVYRPKAQAKLKTKPYKVNTAKAKDVSRFGALAALGGTPKGSRGYEGLDNNSMKAIRSAGVGSGGGGVGSAGRGGIKGYLPGNGLIAGSAGEGSGKAQSAGGYGTRGTGGGRAGYGKISLVGGTSAVSLPLDEEASVEGGLDRDQIIAVINKNRGQIVYCYEKGLQAQPSIGGRVAVDFVIGPAGRITTAKVAQSSLGSRMVENCMLQRMKTWQFPRPVGNVNVDVLYPFELMRVSSR